MCDFKEDLSSEILHMILIRHGMTPGNQLGKYIGVTDEGLSEEGAEELRSMKKAGLWSEEAPEKLYLSPLKRCRETAEILFPGMTGMVVDNLAECNFGVFENKNYQELSDDPRYQAWLDSFCEDPIPGGESKALFQERNVRAFSEIVSDCMQNHIKNAAIVAHGGTIMSILDALTDTLKSYYDWHVENGHGYQLTINGADWSEGKHQVKLLKEI